MSSIYLESFGNLIASRTHCLACRSFCNFFNNLWKSLFWPHALAWDSQDKILHGIVPMISSTKLPIFCIIASIIQVTSSIGWSFHFTKYWKYSCPLVFLYNLLSKIFSSYSGFVVGNCFIQSNSCSSWYFVASSVSLSSYLYKSTTLKIEDIPMSRDNSISYAFAENFLNILHDPIFLNFSLLYSLFGNLSLLGCACWV